MKQGILLGEFTKTMSLKEAIALAKKIGYECVEIPAYDAGSKKEQYDPEGARKLFDWARNQGLAVTSLQCHVGYSAPNWKDCVAHTKKMIDIAQYSGLSVVHTVSGPLPSANVHRQWLKGTSDIAKTPEWANIVSAYKELCDYASSAYVRVAIEPVFVYMVCNLETTKKLLEDVGRNDLYINYDPSHFPYQREDAAQFIKAFANKIIHCHVKDAAIQKENPAEIEKGDAFSMGSGEQFKFAAPGKGVLDWKAIIAALKEIGYNHVLSLEMGHDYEGTPQKIAEDNLKYFKSLL